MEEQRRQGRIARKVRKQAQDPVTKVYITRNGIKELCNTKETVEAACMEEGKARFTQTNNTPPMDPKMLHTFGVAAEKKPAEEVLCGEYDCSQIQDKYLRMLLQAMRMPDKVAKHGVRSDYISKEEHVRAWRKQKPTTGAVEDQLRFKDCIAATFNESMAEIDRLI